VRQEGRGSMTERLLIQLGAAEFRRLQWSDAS
jgi:hypothetical protein